jgi:hypothetical protein
MDWSEVIEEENEDEYFGHYLWSVIGAKIRFWYYEVWTLFLEANLEF